jgi:hypothetical protein
MTKKLTLKHPNKMMIIIAVWWSTQGAEFHKGVNHILSLSKILQRNADLNVLPKFVISSICY